MAEDACAIAEELSHSFALKFLVVYKLALCSIASIMSLIIIIWKGTKWLANPNARLLYFVHVIFVIALPASLIPSYIIDVIRLNKSALDPCDHALRSGFSMHMRLPSIFSLFCQIFTMLSMSLERLISTIVPSKYEVVKSYTISIVLSTASIILASLSSYAFLLPGIRSGEWFPIFSVKREENSGRFLVHTFQEGVLQCITIIIFSHSLYRNNRQFASYLKTKNAQLGKKYQITENRRIIRLLLPLTVAHFIVVVINGFGLFLYSWLVNTHDPASYIIFAEIVFHTPMYALILPIIVYIQLRQRRNVKIHSNVGQDAHFQDLQNLFNGPHRPEKEQEPGKFKHKK